MILLMPPAGHAEESRLALVIGNSNYADSPLINPINDANDMASVLEKLGFTVILTTDAERREMGRAINQFGKQLKAQGGVGVFYYAGHGVQIDNHNYLIPVDTSMSEEDEVPYESIDVGSVLAKMEAAGNSLNLIILDACRNNPFPSRNRSATRGLARVEAPIGSLVVYATAPGAVAADGEGRNGVFTGALLEQLQTDGLSLTQMIRRTRAAVVKATDGLQVPWETSSLLREYYLSNPSPSDSSTQGEPRYSDGNGNTGEVPATKQSVEQKTGTQTLAMLENTQPMEPEREQKNISPEPDLVSIGGGTFTMGCSAEDRQCESFERPSRAISVDSFAIATTEVTVEQFESFAEDTGYITDAEKNSAGNAGCYTWSDEGGISRSRARWGWDETANWRYPGFRQTPQHPVTCVSWVDANRYASWLSEKTGRNYSLPTEAEWEMAARANTSTPYGAAMTSNDLCTFANVADRSKSLSGVKWTSRVACNDNAWFTAPVASYQANQYGLFDMQGNTWEWVADTWSDSISGKSVDESATNEDMSQDHVLRGGGWDSDSRRARISARSKGSASNRASMTGFRLVLR